MATYALELDGVDPTNATPGDYLQIRFAVGEVSSSLRQKRTLIVAPSLAAGDIVQDTQLYGPVTDEADVVARTGDGSPAHLMFVGASENGNKAPTYLLCPTRSAGVAATGTSTVTGTPTGRGTVSLTAAGVTGSFTFDVGDTPTTIAGGLKDNFNAQIRNPVTASNVAGVITLTAKQAGLGGNTIRFKTKSTGQGVAITGAAEAALAGGTTAENHTAALATIAGQRFDLLLCATSDATEMGKIKTHVDNLANPATGLRQGAVFGLALTPAAAVAASQALNFGRGLFFNQEEAPEPSYVLAAKCGGAVAGKRYVTPSPSFKFYGTQEGDVFTVKRATNDSALPTATEIELMLRGGVNPIGAAPNAVAGGQTFLFRVITGRSHNGSLVPDYRLRPAHRVWVADNFADDYLAKLAARPQDAVADDPANPNAPRPGSRFLTPKMAKNDIEELLKLYLDAGHIDPGRYDYMIANTQTGVDPLDKGAINASIPLFSVNLLNKTKSRIDEMSPSG